MMVAVSAKALILGLGVNRIPLQHERVSLNVLCLAKGIV